MATAHRASERARILVCVPTARDQMGPALALSLRCLMVYTPL